jgi:hypothetical protein
MKTLRLLTIPAALVISIGVFANEGDKSPASASDSASVDALRTSLPSTMGFEVDNVRTTDDGVTCINYRVANDLGGETRAQAVVKGDDVLRSTTRSSKFAKAWNKHCASAG